MRNRIIDILMLYVNLYFSIHSMMNINTMIYQFVLPLNIIAVVLMVISLLERRLFGEFVKEINEKYNNRNGYKGYSRRIDNEN